jgi:galactose-6-phosphate isomerase
MPSLDMSDVLLESMFQDAFAVIRRRETISPKGRSIITPYRYNNVIGVICAASPNDLERLGDYQCQGSALSIVTKFKLQGIAKAAVAPGIDSAGQPRPQYQPDTIFWNGSYYLAVTVENYSRYGAGFIQCIAVSSDYIDDQPGQSGMKVQSFDFSNPQDSSYIGSL